MARITLWLPPVLLLGCGVVRADGAADTTRRAGVLYALSECGGDSAALQESLKAYRAARAAWAELARKADGVYARDLTFGLARHLRGHWSDRLPAIDQDIERMGKRGGEPGAPQGEAAVLQAVLAPPRRPTPTCR